MGARDDETDFVAAEDGYGFDHGASISAILGSDDDDDGAYDDAVPAAAPAPVAVAAKPTACKRPREGAVARAEDAVVVDDDDDDEGAEDSAPTEALLAPPDAPRRHRGRRSRADKAAESLRNAFTVLQ